MTFEEGEVAYDQRERQGFIRLNALRLRTLAQARPESSDAHKGTARPARAYNRSHVTEQSGYSSPHGQFRFFSPYFMRCTRWNMPGRVPEP